MIETDKIQEARLFFCDRHDNFVNQKYATIHPYSFHLHNVVAQANRFAYLLHNDNTETVFIACWGHDSIEDGRLTYSDIEKRFGTPVAEIIYCCTDYKGRTRKERKPLDYYERLKRNELALYVKLCDIMANVTFSLLTNSPMLQTYKTEWMENRFILSSNKYSQMIDSLASLFKA